jgi:DNA-binding transcriptional ArsR family regulator
MYLPLPLGTAVQALQSPDSSRRFLLLAETFHALGDTSRVQIVWLLSQNEHNVGDIAKTLSMSQPAVSHHLRTLRNLKLVRVRREGRTSYYSLDDHHIERLLLEGMRHVEELLE